MLTWDTASALACGMNTISKLGTNTRVGIGANVRLTSCTNRKAHGSRLLMHVV